MKQSSILFLLTKNECDLLERIIYLEPGIDEVLDRATMEDDLVRLKFDYADLKDCLDALSCEATQQDSPKEELLALHQKIDRYSRLRQHVLQHGKASRKKTSVDNVYVFDVQMIHYPPKSRKVIRTIAASGKKSLYQFAGAIVKSFGFFFDHGFAFYGDVNKHPTSEQKEIYELFVDIGEEPTAPHAKGVKKVKIEEVFTAIGKTMLFMFDYGDDWRFGVTLKEIRPALDGEKLPKVLNSVGKAPMQYPPCKG
jgi:hypothetical protein